jgi:DNA repair protein RecO (recombination protein O)
MRIDIQPAYVLHTRHFRDSSLLVEFLTPDYGRVSAVVRGVRSSGKSAKQRRSLIQPFLPLLLSWSGNTDLKTITQVESHGVAVALAGQRLFSAMYINELLTRLLQHYDESPDIFALYKWTLVELLNHQYIDVVLRQFEMRLLEYLGYGLDLSSDIQNAQPLQVGIEYLFDNESGFVADIQGNNDRGRIFLGEDLIALAQGNYTQQVRRAAKRLCRLALATHLGPKPLKSRELFS